MSSPAPVEKRTSPRVRPRTLVSLAIYQGEWIPPAYGILRDISESGARIHSDRVLVRGQNVQIRIQFATEPELFETRGRVQWMRPAWNRGSAIAGGALAGVEFSLLSTTSATKLRRLLVSPDFEYPDWRFRQFEDFLAALRPFLLRLGAMMNQAARHESFNAEAQRRREDPRSRR